MKNNKAFSSLEFLITLFFLMLIFVALGLFLRFADNTVKKNTVGQYNKEKIDEILNTIIVELKKDINKNSDSRFDVVWKLDDTEINGFHIKIKSLSGLVNLNFIDKDILLNTDLKTAFNSADSIESVKKIIYENGLLYSNKKLEEFISGEKFEEFFTFYGFANFNIADSESLKIFANDITNSYFGDDFIDKRKILRRNKQFLQNDTELNFLCGIYYDDIYPFVNLNPSLNVNFMKEETLNAILSYPDFEISGVRQKINNLLTLRNVREITQEDLSSILGITKSDELYYYLGCRTWMWEIRIENENTSCKVILARSPTLSSGKSKIYLLEKKWQ